MSDNVPVFSWVRHVQTKDTSFYLRYELWPDCVVKYYAPEKFLAGGAGEYREAMRIALTSITSAHWLSWAALDLDGHDEKGGYVILSCRGVGGELETFCAHLKRLAPNLHVDETHKRQVLDYQSKGMLLAMGVMMGLGALVMWLASFAYGQH
jgi:hypothetical protein